MPSRKTTIVTGEIYHVFNRSIARQTIFKHKSDYERMRELITFYRYFRPTIRYSHFNRLPRDKKQDFIEQQSLHSPLHIEILAYCIMPNHLHFLIKQTGEMGISTFMSNIQNSYAKYFNTKRNRTGALFQEMFKTVWIETDEQLLHVCRYIHLNPFTGFVVKQVTDLEQYAWSSFPSYLFSHDKSFVSTKIISSNFRSIIALKEFTYNQAEYQRKLDKIKHLTFE